MNGMPQSCNCFNFQLNTLLLIICCFSFNNIFRIEGEFFEFFTSFANLIRDKKNLWVIFETFES